MRLFLCALVAGIFAIACHPFADSYAETIARRMAPEHEVKEISDDEAVESLRREQYGYMFDSPSTSSHYRQEMIELQKRYFIAVENREFDEKYVTPIKANVYQKINLGFILVYLSVLLALLISVRRWIRKSGPRAAVNSLMLVAEKVMSKLGTPLRGLLGKSHVRNAEADFLSMKNLHENGLITEDDFNKKKRELQAKIQKNL